MIKTVIPAYWHRSINFGDKLTPYIIEKLTGKKVVYCDAINPCIRLMATGSILFDSGLGTSVIWGNGFASFTEVAYKPHSILAVRGKLTREKFSAHGIECPEVYGDPGLLLPKIYKPNIPKAHRIGIAPHVVDYDIVKFAYGDSVKVIDLRDNIEKIIDEMSQCETMYSSSLHGIIVAHAYGIPCGWVKFSNNIIGDGFKFQDYFSSTHDISINFSELKKPADLNTVPLIQPGRDISQQLLNAFPLPHCLGI